MGKCMWNKMLSVGLIGVLIIGLFAMSVHPYSAEQSHRVKDATDMLANLSDVERQALNELEMTRGFTIDPNINQQSGEFTNVIVEFKQAPAKIEALKQAADGKKITLSSAKKQAVSAHETFKEFLKEHSGKKRLAGAGLAEAEITQAYHDAFNGVAMKVRGDQVQELLRSGVVRTIFADETVTIDPQTELNTEATAMNSGYYNDGVTQIDADKLHQEDITGKGIKVGVIDTGIDYNHPDLKKVYKGGYDFVDDDSDPMETTYNEWEDSGQPEFDMRGSSYYTYHGTHVAGTIAAQQNTSDLIGVAPDVDLYAYRVLGPYGSGTMSGIIAGIDQAVNDDMDVINLSLGSNENNPHSPVAIAVNNAVLSGVVAAVASGNSGPSEKTLGSPGAAALAITVGATDMKDDLAEFSSRGPVEGSHEIKPDVVAPGVQIMSTVAGFVNDHENPDHYEIAYARLSGTSMATPHTAAAAALILQAHPEYSPYEVKVALMNTADEVNAGFASVNEIGAGRINVYEAVHADVALKVLDKTWNGEAAEIEVETGSIGFGSFIKDDDADAEGSARIAFVNRDEKETKTFSTQVSFLPASGEVKDAADNGVEVSIPDSVEVPAGQTVEIEPTLLVPADAKFGRYEGYIHVVHADNPDEQYQIPFSVRVASKGIDKFIIDNIMTTNDFKNRNPFSIEGISAMIKLSTPLEHIDFIVKDGDTEEAIGLVGTVDTSDALTDIDYIIEYLFKGKMYPFTSDDANPISKKEVKLAEGDYILEAIGHEANGKTYKRETIVYVNNTPPEVSLSLEPGVYEVDDSMYTYEDGYDGEAVWIHGNVHDPAIDVLKEKGVNISQAWNHAVWWEYNVYLNKQLSIDKDGNFRFPAMKERIDEMPLDSNVFVLNNAKVAGKYPASVNQYWFVKEGETYAQKSYDKQSAKLGDSVTMTIDMNNIEAFMSGDFKVTYNQFLELEHVEINEAFQQLADAHGSEVTLDEPNDQNGSVAVGASVDQDFDIDESVPFIDVTFKVVNDEDYYNDYDPISVGAFNYETQTHSDIVRVLTVEQLTILPSTSVIYGYVSPEAFLEENGFVDFNKDFEKLGAKVYAKDADGNRYDAKIEYSYFEISGLPLDYETYDIFVEMPGHLTSRKTVEINQHTIDEEPVGERVSVNMDPNYAGDINGDGVIDILDIMRVVAQYGKQNDAADMNQDGIVDEQDIRFIEKNFLRVDPEQHSKTPMEKLGKKGLEDFLKAIGLEPAK